MKPIVRAALPISLTTLLMFTGACRREIALPPDLPRLTPCTIMLTQEGEPFPEAYVTLNGTEENPRWYPGGQTDSGGKAVLLTNGRYAGVPEGKYKITITKIESETSKLPPRPMEDDPAFPAWMEKAQNEKLSSYSFVEKRYADSKTSPLEIEISGSKAVVATFDVGKKVRVKVD